MKKIKELFLVFENAILNNTSAFELDAIGLKLLEYYAFIPRRPKGKSSVLHNFLENDEFADFSIIFQPLN